MFEPKRTRQIIRQWDSRDKGTQDKSIGNEIAEIAESWRAFSEGDATKRQQLIAFEVHKYLLGVDQKKVPRDVIGFMVAERIERGCSVKGAITLTARSLKKSDEAVRKDYERWSQDKVETSGCVPFPKLVERRGDKIFHPKIHPYVYDKHELWEVLLRDE